MGNTVVKLVVLQNGILVCGSDNADFQVLFIGQLGVEVDPDNQDV